LAKPPFPSPSSVQNREGRGEGSSGAAGRRRLPASRATAAARRWGRTKRATRETDSHPHLGLGRREDVDRRRRTEGGGGARGGGAVELGEGLCELGGAVWSGEEARGLFIGGLRRFGGGGDFSPASSTPASSSSFSTAPGDTTSRQRRQVNTCRGGLGRPWWQRRQPVGVARRDGSE
jgi:hypothetical protein